MLPFISFGGIKISTNLHQPDYPLDFEHIIEKHGIFQPYLIYQSSSILKTLWNLLLQKNVDSIRNISYVIDYQKVEWFCPYLTIWANFVRFGLQSIQQERWIITGNSVNTTRTARTVIIARIACSSRPAAAPSSIIQPQLSTAGCEKHRWVLQEACTQNETNYPTAI